MHNAPSVSYPVGRSRFHVIGLLVIALVGIATGLLWRQQAQPPVWQQILFLLVWLLSSSAAVWRWRDSPCGVLRWDGQLWHWDLGGSTVIGQLTVQLDLQHVLLLHLRAASGAATWFWLERGGETILWDALRRAAFSDVQADLKAAVRADDQSVN